MNHDFSTVTEIPGEEVSTEQIEHLTHRYRWAAQYCKGQDVLEVACGAGQGLGILASVSATLRAGDISATLVARARAHYGARVSIEEMDACAVPTPDASLDVVLLFEAIYYLPSPEKFVRECRRILRPGGRVLVVTANKDLFDFNPSPFSYRYLGVMELADIFHRDGFSTAFYGVTPTDSISMRQRILRPTKMLAARLKVIPKTMSGKKFLKRLVFGQLTTMPSEITDSAKPFPAPAPLVSERPDTLHKVIYCAATLV